MLSIFAAIIAGIVFGRWLGSQQVPKVAAQRVRVGDLRRNVQLRR